MPVRERAEAALCRAGLYRPARNAYQRLLNREHYEHRRTAREFFGRFVGPGQLAFDVGANHGRVSEMFLELGARAVAIEPQPKLAEKIRRRYEGPRLAVEACAVGATPGTATLHLGVDDAHSTLSEASMELVADARWSGTVQVPVRTLDQLIEAHGEPDFIKIDVEGYETEALAGLSRPVTALSFEFRCAAPDVAGACMARLLALAPYQFATAGEERRLDARWTDPEGIQAAIARLGDQDPRAYGDVYAVRER